MDLCDNFAKKSVSFPFRHPHRPYGHAKEVFRTGRSTHKYVSHFIQSAKSKLHAYSPDQFVTCFEDNVDSSVPCSIISVILRISVVCGNERMWWFPKWTFQNCSDWVLTGLRRPSSSLPGVCQVIGESTYEDDALIMIVRFVQMGQFGRWTIWIRHLRASRLCCLGETCHKGSENFFRKVYLQTMFLAWSARVGQALNDVVDRVHINQFYSNPIFSR